MEVNLGAIRFNWKGAYAGATAYVADDVVSSGGASYICILASTGNAVSNATYWSVMSSAGTNGTDVGTTITTQGDLLFRDASGLQRLAKGTGAQTLKMNAGATAPEWATVAAGGYTSEALVSLTSGTEKDITIPSGVTSIVLHFNLISQTGSSIMPMQLGDAGGIETSGYVSSGLSLHNSSTPQAQQYTTQFIIGIQMVFGDVLVGTVTLTRGDTSTHYWSVISVFSDYTTSDLKIQSGNKTLSAELTTIRLMGGGTFDGAGSYGLTYM
jgi:hypothetical protein